MYDIYRLHQLHQLHIIAYTEIIGIQMNESGAPCKDENMA